jgi:bacteriorhodopsin
MLYAGFAVFLAASLILLIAFYLHMGDFKIVITFAFLLNAIAAIAYLTAVLSDNSATLTCGDRAFEWLRYAAWVTQAPITITLLAVVTRVSMYEAAWTAALSVVGVGALYAGAMSPNCVSAWPLFAFGIATGVVLAVSLTRTFKTSALKSLPEAFHGTVTFAVTSFLVMWIGYAIVWGVSEGGKVTTPAQEIIVYTVFDIITKAVIPGVIVLNIQNVFKTGRALAWLGQDGTQYDFSITKHQ